MWWNWGGHAGWWWFVTWVVRIWVPIHVKGVQRSDICLSVWLILRLITDPIQIKVWCIRRKGWRGRDISREGVGRLWNCRKRPCWCKVSISEDMGVERIDASVGEGQVDQLWCYACCAHLHILGDNIMMIHANIFINAVVAMWWPLVLNLGKNCNIERLELMGAFGRESKDEYVVFICNWAELISFMGIITIKKEEDRGIVHFVCVGKWDKYFLKPFEAKFIISPPIGWLANCSNQNFQVRKCRSRPFSQDKCRRDRQTSRQNTFNDSDKFQVVQANLIKVWLFQTSKMKEFFWPLLASTKLQPLLIHVPYMLGWEIRVCIINHLEELIKTCNIWRVKIFFPLWIKASRPWIGNLRTTFLEPIDPVFAWSCAS